MAKKYSAVLTKRLIQQRLKEVGAIRDQIRDDISELETLAESCESAEHSLVVALDEFRNAADEMSRVV